MLRFAEQTHNSRELYISPIQYIYSANFRFPAPEIKERCRLHNQLFIGNDLCGQKTTTIYCGPLTNSKMKDMFTYHNKCKTIKTAVQTSNLEK